MLIADFFKTFSTELSSFIHDIQRDITNILASIHHFLNKYMSDDILTMFLIAIGAFVAILIFRAVINRR